LTLDSHPSLPPSLPPGLTTRASTWTTVAAGGREGRRGGGVSPTRPNLWGRRLPLATKLSVASTWTPSCVVWRYVCFFPPSLPPSLPPPFLR
jgi:hypothetical protein